jgi:hypothetical protein
MPNFKPLSAFFGTSLLLSLTSPLAITPIAKAESPENAPTELKQLIVEIDKAANLHSTESLLKLYSPNFTNTDGLDNKKLSTLLSNLWKEYPDLHYATQLLSWKKEQDQIIAETETKIEGTSQQKGRTFQLSSIIKSQQVFQDNHLLKQEILEESTQVKSGNKPPAVEVNLPLKVKVGQQFDFDVIIKEPLTNDISVGYAIKETVESGKYLKPSDFDLEVLQSGGIFKRVKAPNTPENQWLSAILVQSDGMTIVTQRLRIEK